MSAPSQQNHNSALVVLTTLFFMMGFITCMNDILIPHLKEIFELTYVQAMLIQFCFLPPMPSCRFRWGISSVKSAIKTASSAASC